MPVVSALSKAQLEELLKSIASAGTHVFNGVDPALLDAAAATLHAAGTAEPVVGVLQPVAPQPDSMEASVGQSISKETHPAPALLQAAPLSAVAAPPEEPPTGPPATSPAKPSSARKKGGAKKATPKGKKDSGKN
uniref:Uncharacterized protein n=1 Tax=Haptolina ericina TaxID=156174 RepID=A0A7S3APW6_9EUKA